VTAPPEDWPRDAGGIAFPPAPWRLVGTAYVSLWQVAADRVPSEHLGPALAIARLGGRAAVATIFAAYGPEGDLAYGEFLVAVRVRGEGRSFTHVPRIWVDHPSSVAGARALWRIPKEVATFRFEGERAVSAEASTPDGTPVAALRFNPGPALPGRWPARTRIAQGPLGACDPPVTITPATARARVRLGRAEWTFHRGGPVGFLAEAKPLASARLEDVALLFG
jgi:hypothetical protein